MGNKEIIDYIGKRYSFFKKLSLTLTRDEQKADDLLSSVIIQYSNREDIITRNINGFIYWSLKNNYYSKSSPYAVLYQKSFDYIDNLNIAEDDENENICLYNEIVKKVLECPELTWYEKKIANSSIVYKR